MKKALLVLLSVSLFTAILLALDFANKNKKGDVFTVLRPEKKVDLQEFKTFESAEDFKNYLAKSPENDYYRNSFAEPVMMKESSFDSVSLSEGKSTARYNNIGSNLNFKTKRSSTTNTQVVGIDELDIVKTDGKNIYLDQENFYPIFLEKPMFIDNDIETKPMPPIIKTKPGVKLINATPPGDMKLIKNLDAKGEMLINKKNLIVFDKNNKKIHGFDITNNDANKKWELEINQDNTEIKTARLLDNDLYIITNSYIERSKPCPIIPLKSKTSNFEISCGDIYHPTKPSIANTTYSVMKIDASTGKLQYKTSFIGSYDLVVYMSEENLYVAYENNVNETDVMFDFLLSKNSPFPNALKQKVSKIRTYDISENSKRNEFEIIAENYFSSLSEDEALKVENNFSNKAEIYFKKNLRKLENTTVAKITLKNLDLTKTGTIPGHLLNQFSMDEYKGNFRVAVTIGSSIPVETKSESDVYILDKKMNIIGSVTGMGEGERIYSVRFIEDKAYVVTFRETDPFYVLDLKSPKNPKITGELKIPGYSSYLHKVDKNLILGIGKENGKVKLSLFDVSDVNNPKETSKYMLNEYHSEAVNNHHAFLLDSKHGVFFLPGSKGGYIFSFEKGQLEMKKAISTNQVKRALYINNYMYIVANDSIIVLNENDWEKVQNFSISNYKN